MHIHRTFMSETFTMHSEAYLNNNIQQRPFLYMFSTLSCHELSPCIQKLLSLLKITTISLHIHHFSIMNFHPACRSYHMCCKHRLLSLHMHIASVQWPHTNSYLVFVCAVGVSKGQFLYFLHHFHKSEMLTRHTSIHPFCKQRPPSSHIICHLQD